MEAEERHEPLGKKQAVELAWRACEISDDKPRQLSWDVATMVGRGGLEFYGAGDATAAALWVQRATGIIADEKQRKGDDGSGGHPHYALFLDGDHGNGPGPRHVPCGLASQIQSETFTIAALAPSRALAALLRAYVAGSRGAKGDLALRGWHAAQLRVSTGPSSPTSSSADARLRTGQLHMDVDCPQGNGTCRTRWPDMRHGLTTSGAVRRSLSLSDRASSGGAACGRAPVPLHR